MRSLALFVSSLLSLNCAAAEVVGNIGVSHWSYSNAQEAVPRYMPNYSYDSNVQNIYTINYGITQSFNRVNLAVELNADSLGEARVGRAELAYQFSKVGASIGILPFRVSQCRKFDSNNIWIAEPDNFCRFNGLNEISSSAAGIQLWNSSYVNGYTVDYQIGYYKPTIDNQDKKLNVYLPIGENVLHNKYGFSVRASGDTSQFSFGFLRSHQEQESLTTYARRLHYDTYYLGIEKSISDFTFRATAAAYLGENVQVDMTYRAVSRTAELSYKIGNKITTGCFLAKYTNETLYVRGPETRFSGSQYLSVPSYGCTVRLDLDRHYLIVQALHTNDDFRSVNNVYTNRSGDAIGIKLGMDL